MTIFYKINLIAVLVCLFSPLAFAGAMEELCDEMKKAPPPPMWGADYVANVDVYGHRVVPADLNSSKIIPDPLVIPIEIDLIQRFGIALPADLDMTPEVFRVNIFADGRVTYNDQDITPKVKESCDEYHDENFDQTRQPHGQNDSNTVPSDDTIEGQYPPLNE